MASGQTALPFNLLQTARQLHNRADLWVLRAKRSRAHFRDRREDLYARYRLAKTQEETQKVIRDMQKFNMEARKYSKAMISPITATSLRQAALQKPEKAVLAFGRVVEAIP